MTVIRTRNPEQGFLEALYKFYEDTLGTQPPDTIIVHDVQVTLWEVWTAVSDRGGWTQVSAGGRWASIARLLQLPEKYRGHAGVKLKRAYQTILLKFEEACRNGATDLPLSPAAPLVADCRPCGVVTSAVREYSASLRASSSAGVATTTQRRGVTSTDAGHAAPATVVGSGGKAHTSTATPPTATGNTARTNCSDPDGTAAFSSSAGPCKDTCLSDTASAAAPVVKEGQLPEHTALHTYTKAGGKSSSKGTPAVWHSFSGGAALPEGFTLQTRYRKGSGLPWVQLEAHCKECNVIRHIDRREKLERFLSDHGPCCPAWNHLTPSDFNFRVPGTTFPHAKKQAGRKVRKQGAGRRPKGRQVLEGERSPASLQVRQKGGPRGGGVQRVGGKKGAVKMGLNTTRGGQHLSSSGLSVGTARRVAAQRLQRIRGRQALSAVACTQKAASQRLSSRRDAVRGRPQRIAAQEVLGADAGDVATVSDAQDIVKVAGPCVPAASAPTAPAPTAPAPNTPPVPVPPNKRRGRRKLVIRKYARGKGPPGGVRKVLGKTGISATAEVKQELTFSVALPAGPSTPVAIPAHTTTLSPAAGPPLSPMDTGVPAVEVTCAPQDQAMGVAAEDTAVVPMDCGPDPQPEVSVMDEAMQDEPVAAAATSAATQALAAVTDDAPRVPAPTPAAPVAVEDASMAPLGPRTRKPVIRYTDDPSPVITAAADGTHAPSTQPATASLPQAESAELDWLARLVTLPRKAGSRAVRLNHKLELGFMQSQTRRKPGGKKRSIPSIQRTMLPAGSPENSKKQRIAGVPGRRRGRPPKSAPCNGITLSEQGLFGTDASTKRQGIVNQEAQTRPGPGRPRKRPCAEPEGVLHGPRVAQAGRPGTGSAADGHPAKRPRGRPRKIRTNQVELRQASLTALHMAGLPGPSCMGGVPGGAPVSGVVPMVRPPNVLLGNGHLHGMPGLQAQIGAAPQGMIGMTQFVNPALRHIVRTAAMVPAVPHMSCFVPTPSGQLPIMPSSLPATYPLPTSAVGTCIADSDAAQAFNITEYVNFGQMEGPQAEAEAGPMVAGVSQAPEHHDRQPEDVTIAPLGSANGRERNWQSNALVAMPATVVRGGAEKAGAHAGGARSIGDGGKSKPGRVIGAAQSPALAGEAVLGPWAVLFSVVTQSKYPAQAPPERVAPSPRHAEEPAAVAPSKAPPPVKAEGTGKGRANVFEMATEDTFDWGGTFDMRDESSFMQAEAFEMQGGGFDIPPATFDMRTDAFEDTLDGIAGVAGAASTTTAATIPATAATPAAMPVTALGKPSAALSNAVAREKESVADPVATASDDKNCVKDGKEDGAVAQDEEAAVHSEEAAVPCHNSTAEEHGNVLRSKDLMESTASPAFLECTIKYDADAPSAAGSQSVCIQEAEYSGLPSAQTTDAVTPVATGAADPQDCETGHVEAPAQTAVDPPPNDPQGIGLVDTCTTPKSVLKRLDVLLLGEVRSILPTMAGSRASDQSVDTCFPPCEQNKHVPLHAGMEARATAIGAEAGELPGGRASSFDSTAAAVSRETVLR